MKPSLRNLPLLAAAIAASAFLFTLAGCGGTAASAPPPPPPGSYPGATFSGKAMAGSQPILGAAIQLYAAGTTGNGFAATSLLTTALTTDATGTFTVPAAYPCPSATSQLYLIASGGKVGSAAANQAITLATVLGVCNQLAVSSQFLINEVTTTATVWALSQFFTASTSLGASSTNAQGLANAVATAASLANLTTGVSPGATFPATGTSPAPRINTIANLLNTCTAATSQTPCTQLFTATTPGSGTPPDNTFAAALNLVRNPANNVAALYTQSTASTAFTPALGKAPADWTLFLSYTGGGMNYPTALGLDATGNVWVASYFGVASKFSPTGSPIFPSGITGSGLCDSYGLAIDAANNVWITNEADTPRNCVNSVTALNPSGQSISGTQGYTAGGLNYPAAIAIDTNSTAWVVDYGNSHLTVLSTTSGQPTSGAAGYPSAGTANPLAFPIAVAVDASHNAWIANPGNDTVTKVSPDGKFTSYSCCNSPTGLAIDQGGNVWVANYFGNSVSEISSAGTVFSSGYTSGSLINPQGIAIDGSGNVWVASVLGPSITRLAGATSSSPGQILSPASGFAPDANLLKAFAIAIDASGNLWVTNSGNDTLTEFVGLAPPVKTPLLGPPQTP